MPKEQQLTSNQSITIDDCMMVTLHRSKKSNACQKKPVEGEDKAI